MSDSSTTTSRSDDSERLKDRSHRAGDRSSEAPPDWDHIPFAVGCARCGCDLRGLSDPKCPQCQLEFEWSVAVPIEKLTCETCDYNLYGLSETRCPECGESFTWDGALAAYHRKRIPRFEYQWRRRPVRSLIGTWFHALRPGKFWRSVDIHDPPQRRALFVMVALILMFLLMEVGVLQGFDDWLWRSVRFWMMGGYGWSLRGYGPTPSIPFTDLLVELPTLLAGGFTGRELRSTLLQTTLWVSTSFFALLLFPQSMRQCKVHVGQVVRVWAHALPMALPVACFVTYLYSFLCALLSLRYSDTVGGLIAAPLLIHVVWSLRCGYGTYLRMGHALGIAFASQVVAVLSSSVIEMALTSNLTQTLFYRMVTAWGFA